MAEEPSQASGQRPLWPVLLIPAIVATLVLGSRVVAEGEGVAVDPRFVPFAGAMAAFGCSLVAAAVSQGGRVRAWLLVAAGCSGWAAWHAVDAGTSRRIDFLLDLSSVCLVGSFAGGVLMLVRFAEGRTERVSLSLDTLPLAIALAVGVWVLSVGPLVVDPALSPGVRAAAIVRGAGIVILLVVGGAGVLSRARVAEEPIERLLLAASTVLGLADAVWLRLERESGQLHTWAIDLLFAASFGMVATAAVVGVRRRDGGGRDLPAGGRPSWESQLPDFALAGLLVLTGAQALFGETVRYGIVTTIAGALAMLAFIVTRQSIVLRRDRHLRQEIGELSAQIDGLISQVGRDPLTGLYNHRAVHERIDHELAVGRATAEPVAVALIDVDNFKTINDSLGHQAGDRVLRAVSSILTAACRSTDVAARYAGDEFMLVLPGLDETHAGGVCARIAQEVRRINEDLNLAKGVRVSLSVGVAVTHGCQRSVAQTVAIADAAMYDAKESGKDRVVVVNADTLVISTTHAPERTPDVMMAESRIALWAERDRRVG